MYIKNPCRCNCGYTCNQQCDLPRLDCIEQHYKRDCDHKWDGPSKDWISTSGGLTSSVTCSKCGMSAFDHDATVGP